MLASAHGEHPAEKSPLHATPSRAYGAPTADARGEASRPRSLASALLFTWVSPFVALANARDLTPADLLPLGDASSYEQSAQRLASAWASERSRNGRSASLLAALTRAFRLRVAALASVRAVSGAVATLLPPLLLEAIINYAADPTASVARGLFFALVVLVSGVFQSLVRRQLDYLSAELAVAVESSVSTAVLMHTLEVSPSTLQRTASDDIVSYATTHPSKLRIGLLACFSAVGAVCQIVFGGVLLYQYLGIAMWPGLIVAITSVGCVILMDKARRQYELPVMEIRDERLRLTQESLAGIKTLKLLTWETSVTERIVELKDTELRLTKQHLSVVACTSVLTTFAPLLSVAASLLVYVVLMKGPIEPATTLPALTLVNLLLRDSFMPLFARLSEVRDAWKSLKRTKAYLAEPKLSILKAVDPTNGSSVTVKNADFKWERMDSNSEIDRLLEAQGILEIPVAGPVLRNINYYARPGELHAVVGASKNGKSSFLAGIAGLIRCTQGDVLVHGSVAYITREPFMLDASVRDNICFGQPFEEEKYARAVQASCVQHDCSSYPRGDRTGALSEQGCSLTLAQRIRITLARSLYLNSDIYLLDDILAPMDDDMRYRVFKAFVQFALKDKIVIMATQSLGEVKSSSNVVVLAQGTIVESGSYKALIAKKKETFLSDVLIDRQTTGKRESESQGANAEPPNGAGEDSGSDDLPRMNFSEFAPNVRDNVMQGSFTEDGEDENLPHGSAGHRILNAAGGKGYVAAATVFLLYLLAPIFAFYALTSIGDAYSPEDLLEGFIGFSALETLTIVASSTTLTHSLVHAIREIHRQLLGRLHRAPMAFYDATPLNQVFGRVSKDLPTIENAVSLVCPLLFTSLAQMIVTTGVLMAYSPWLMLVFAPLMLGFYRIQECCGKPVQALDRIGAATSPSRQCTVAEVLQGTAAIRFHKAEHLFISKFKNQLALHSQSIVSKACVASWLGIRVDSLHIALLTCSALAGIHLSESDEVAALQQAGRLGVALMLAFGLGPFLFDFVKSCDAVWIILRAGGRVKAFTKLPIEASLRSTPDLQPQGCWPTASSIEFTNVSLRYRPGLPRILRGVSFAVNGGSSLAIIGSDGSGKRSVFAALTRLVELTTGTISIDAVDVNKIGLHDLRSIIASLTQDPVLFAGSIRSNLDATFRFTDSEIWTVIKQVQLGGVIFSLDDVVKEKAANYSEGERQLLAIARAILRRPKIVLIEESDALATLAEADLIDRCLQQEFQHSTRLVITHRPTTAMAADQVLVMVNGQIAEHGAPKELQKSSRSMFRSILEDWKRRDRRKKP